MRRPLGDYGVPITSLVRGGRARAMLARTFGPEPAIEELEREFFCVSCDLVTGEQVVHRSGPVADAVAASMCLPGIFTPIRQAGSLLVDGGVLDSLPVGPMAAHDGGTDPGGGRRAALRPRTSAGRPRRSHRGAVDGRAHGDRADGQAHLPTIKETLARSLVLGSIESARAARRRADVVVEPDTGTCDMLDFGRLDEMVEAGRRAARQALSGRSRPGGAGHAMSTQRCAVDLPMQCLGSDGQGAPLT